MLQPVVIGVSVRCRHIRIGSDVRHERFSSCGVSIKERFNRVVVDAGPSSPDTIRLILRLGANADTITLFLFAVLVSIQLWRTGAPIVAREI